MNEKRNTEGLRPLDDGVLAAIGGGTGRPKYVSSFFCEKCGKTIRLNGVYLLENARKLHDEKEHRSKK